MIGQRAELVASRQPGADERAAYERVLTDALEGDATLFARMDYVEEAWRIVDPVLTMNTPVREYEPGTWGPADPCRGRHTSRRMGKPCDGRRPLRAWLRPDDSRRMRGDAALVIAKVARGFRALVSVTAVGISYARCLMSNTSLPRSL